MDVSIHDLNFSKPDMVLFAMRDHLDTGVWPVIKDSVTDVRVEDFLNFAELEYQGFVGVTVVGSRNVTDAFNILNHLSPNIFVEPGYIESLLYPRYIELFREDI